MKMFRRLVVRAPRPRFAGLLVACLLGFPWLASAAAAPARPNILFVMADQWRASAFG